VLISSKVLESNWTLFDLFLSLWSRGEFGALFGDLSNIGIFEWKSPSRFEMPQSHPIQTRKNIIILKNNLSEFKKKVR
jgi:hypothetical protein